MDSSHLTRTGSWLSRVGGLGCCVVAALAGAQAPVPESAVPASFVDVALRVDVDNHITEGREQRPLTHRELFTRLERNDLLAELDARAVGRTRLIVAAVALSAVAIGVGSVLLATSPNLASPACESDVRIYNEVCVPRVRLHTISGTSTIATGVVVALVLAGFAYQSDQVLVSRDDTQSMVNKYNAALARKLRGGPQGLRIFPVFSPDGAAVAATFRF